jgi:VIT1/CCC1 family predicted Fe2+/Mn2+ transporter
MSYSWSDLVGNIGVALIILAYLGLQLGRLDGRDLAYSVANAIGAALVIVSLMRDFNLSAFVIEAFWVAISLIGIWRWRRGRSARR